MAFCHFYHLAIFTNQNRLLVYLPIRIRIEIIGIGIASVKIGIASKVMTTFLDQLHGYRTLSSTGLDLIKKACHPPATAPTPTAQTDRANDFKFLLDVHKYCLFPATCRNCEFLSQFYTIFEIVKKNRYFLIY